MRPLVKESLTTSKEYQKGFVESELATSIVFSPGKKAMPLGLVIESHNKITSQQNLFGILSMSSMIP